jgi:2-dehydropantoate 2-reductase
VQIRIIGAGALGMLFASQLSAANAQLILITHTNIQRDILKINGLKSMDHAQEKTHLIETCCMDSIEFNSSSSESVDWIFLTVKQKDITESLLKKLSAISTPETRMVCFQNGIGHMELIKTVFPVNRLYAAITTEAALKLSDQTVRHTGKGTTWIGRTEEACNNANLFDQQEIKLQTLLTEAGFEVFLSKKMISLIWNKLLINAIINPITAIMQINNGALLQSIHLMDLMKALFDEGCLVARKLGIKTAEDLWKQLLQVCEKTADNQSSMMKDIAEGRTTEIDWINGALLGFAEKLGMALPAHQTLYRMIKHLESR